MKKILEYITGVEDLTLAEVGIGLMYAAGFLFWLVMVSAVQYIIASA